MHLVQLLLPRYDEAVSRELTERFGGVTAYARALEQRFGGYPAAFQKLHRDAIAVLRRHADARRRQLCRAFFPQPHTAALA